MTKRPSQSHSKRREGRTPNAAAETAPRKSPPPLTPFTTPAGGLAVGMGPRPRRRTWTLAVPRGRQPWMATLQVCAVEACACVRPPARGNHDRSFFFFFLRRQ